MQIYNNVVNVNNHEKPSPAFKSGMGSFLTMSGNIMQGIENRGFLASFLIQDGLGMTVPRTYKGFQRDKEITGKYNIQEGKEVFGREGLTGPCMMAVAPLMFLAAAKFGRSTSVNTSLIKRFGNNLRDIVKNSNFDKSLLKDSNKFKQHFYKTSVQEMLENSLGKNNISPQDVEYVLKEIAKYEKIPAGEKLHSFRGKAKYRDNCMKNIVEHINNIRYNTSNDLNLLGKVKVGKADDAKVYSIKNALDAMIKYSDDAIVANKHLDKLDELSAESIRNKSISKRLIANVSTIFATLGVLSVLPKIYASSDTAPGALTANELKNKSDNITFKSRRSILDKFGKKVANNKKYDKLSQELEYNGYNFTNSLMAGLSLFGLLAPRGIHAYNRAKVDESGKKDLTELWEIFIRDVVSSLAVVFFVPMATRAVVTGYEKKSGFVLMDKDRNLTKKQTILDLLNPYSKAHVMTNTEISALYNGVNNQAKMLNFCKFINKNGGDLEKILSKSEYYKEFFAGSNIDLATNKSVVDKNKKIISYIESLGEKSCDKKSLNEKITKLMTNSKIKNNKIAAFARGMNSLPELITTFLVSPILLGLVIPEITYMNTQRIHAKKQKERIMQSNIELNG